MPGQPTAMPLDERIGNVIKRAEQAVIAAKTAVLRPFGLTVPQYAALVALAEQPGISGARLARLCGVSAQAMNGVIGLLEQRGLIRREPSPDHGRVLLARLTRAGHALLRSADARAVAVERRLAAAYTGAEREQLCRLLETAVATLDEARQELAAGGT